MASFKGRLAALEARAEVKADVTNENAIGELMDALKKAFDAERHATSGTPAYSSLESNIRALAQHILDEMLTDGDKRVLAALPAGALAACDHPDAADFIINTLMVALDTITAR